MALLLWYENEAVAFITILGVFGSVFLQNHVFCYQTFYNFITGCCLLEFLQNV